MGRLDALPRGTGHTIRHVTHLPRPHRRVSTGWPKQGGTMGVEAPALPLLVCAARQPRGSRAAYEQPAGAAARWLARGALHVLGVLLGQQRREHAARDSSVPCYSPPSPIGPNDSGGSCCASQPCPLPLDQRAGRGRCGLPAPGQAGLTDRVPTGHQHPAATNPRLRPHATPPLPTGGRDDWGCEH